MSFRVASYTVKTNKLKACNRLSMVFLSDLHLTEHGVANGELIRKINELHPDMVLIGGDMVTAKEGYPTAIAEELVCALSKDFPVYYALGNHEMRYKVKQERFGNAYELFAGRLKNMGVHILDDVCARISDKNINIYGLSLPLMHFRRFTRHKLPLEEITDRIGLPDREKFNLLLAHHPRYAETYVSWGADLTLSGHVHGGVMRIGKRPVISPDFQLFPKYGYGEHSFETQKLLISAGLGEHTIPFRIFNPKELLYIEIIQEVSHGDSR